jgi:hypothetical protein
MKGLAGKLGAATSRLAELEQALAATRADLAAAVRSFKRCYLTV